jgi:hypothetical protein
VGRGGHQGYIHLAGDVRHGGIAIQSHDVLLFGIYRVDRAFIMFFQQGPDGLIASFGGHFTCADHRHRMGIEDVLKFHEYLLDQIIFSIRTAIDAVNR